jgi:cysteine desulfurase
MSTNRIYLDYSATTPVDETVVQAMLPYFTQISGNASSAHWAGRQAKLALEESREELAAGVGCHPDELVFTSGGTEADTMALVGIYHASRASGKNHIIVSSIEHHAILHTAEYLRSLGADVTVLPVTPEGLVLPETVEQAIRPETCLISIMHVNNEVGTIQPIERIGALAGQHGICMHIDAVQSFGKIPWKARELPVDLLSLSAHKIYGPKGIGALYVRKGTMLPPLLHGGAQEANRRAGTEPVALAVGFAQAARLAGERMGVDVLRIAQLKTLFVERLRKTFPELLFNGDPERSIPHLVNVSFDSNRLSVDGDALLMGMDIHGIAVSTGSACASGSIQPSHVLLAMGRNAATAKASLRFSLGHATTKEELDAAVDALREVIETMKRR